MTAMQNISTELVEEFDEVMLADGFEEALVGFGYQFTNQVAIYDYEACITIIMRNSDCSEAEAAEFMDYNVVGSYIGANTPVFITRRVD